MMWAKLLAVVSGLLIGYWLIDDFNPESLKGKRVLITGASTGIGEQLAYHYARLGANIVITARRQNRLEEVIAHCQQLGNPDQTYEYVVADMNELNSTEMVIKEAVYKLGGLDYLVLNHIVLLNLGEWEGGEQNLTKIDMVMRVNFQSYVYLASYSLPHLRKSHGSLVVVSSLAGKMGQPFTAIYSASKFALEGFFSALRQEFKMKSSDITVTVCVLGMIGTENAVKQLSAYGQEFLLSIIKPASPSDTALAIVKGAATRVREVYYPYYQVRPIILLKDWFPAFFEYINRFPFTRVS